MIPIGTKFESLQYSSYSIFFKEIAFGELFSDIISIQINTTTEYIHLEILYKKNFSMNFSNSIQNLRHNEEIFIILLYVAFQ